MRNLEAFYFSECKSFFFVREMFHMVNSAMTHDATQSVVFAGYGVFLG